MKRRLFISGVIVCAIVAMTSCKPVSERETYVREQKGDYSLVLTMVDGNEYVIDHGLTRSDCYQAIANTFGPVTPKGVYCEAKQ